MRIYTEHCDLCKKEFENDKHGFCLEIGYSKGGWGHRQDFTPKMNIEVCNSCFEVLKQKAMQLDETIKRLQA